MYQPSEQLDCPPVCCAENIRPYILLRTFGKSKSPAQTSTTTKNNFILTPCSPNSIPSYLVSPPDRLLRGRRQVGFAEVDVRCRVKRSISNEESLCARDKRVASGRLRDRRRR